MPLPFKTSSVADQIMAKRKPEGGLDLEVEESPDVSEGAMEPEMPEDDGMSTAAQDLIDAVQAGDVEGVANAFRSAFQIMESAPHDEYEATPEEMEQSDFEEGME